MIEVSEAAAMQSEVMKKFLEEESNSEEEIVTVIPLSNVRGEILKKVIEWMKKKQSESTEEDDEILEWEKRYVDLDVEVMYELVTAAMDLDVKALPDRCCQKIADMIAGKSAEEIREMFGIENDLTPQEEAEPRKQNAWNYKSPQTETRSESGSGSGSNGIHNQ